MKELLFYYKMERRLVVEKAYPKKTNGSLYLRKNDFLGKGVHKAVYIHPQNNKLCVKVPYTLPDTDIAREFAYRKVLQVRKKAPVLLTEYHGEVDTNYGKGFVFDRIVDYDGHLSVALKSILLQEVKAEEHLGISAFELLLKLRDMMLQDNIVVSDMDPVNFLVVRVSPAEYTLKVIDNIGTPAVLPLAYYFDFLAAQRMKRYWNRFINRCRKKYAGVLAAEDWAKLEA